MVELNLFCHPCLKQECKLLKLPKNSILHDCNITTKKSLTSTLFKELFLVARGTAESKQNEPSLLPLCNCSAGVLSQRAHTPLNLCRVVLCRNKQEIVQKGFQLSRQDIIQPKKKKKSSIGRFLTFKMLQQTCFSSTEQHLAPCPLSQVHMQVSQHRQCSRKNCPLHCSVNKMAVSARRCHFFLTSFFQFLCFVTWF